MIRGSTSKRAQPFEVPPEGQAFKRVHVAGSPEAVLPPPIEKRKQAVGLLSSTPDNELLTLLR